MSVVVAAQDIVTAYGRGLEPLWQGLLSGVPAFAPVKRFDTSQFQCRIAGTVQDLNVNLQESLVIQMLRPLLQPLAGKLPDGVEVLLASTTGEVDLLEKNILTGSVPPDEAGLDHLLARVVSLLQVPTRGRLVSAACASATSAAGYGAMLIESGRRDAVLVVACDAVTEFVYSGFSSLMALDPDGARPFDRARKGLTIGEAAGYILLMSESAALKQGRDILCRLAGWGFSCDANHMTGSSRDGVPLSVAIQKALGKARMDAGSIGSISAHGTGTMYNDSMEMKAFKRICGSKQVPTYSVKGAVGHTMGAAGLVDMLAALKSLRAGIVPPSVNMRDVDPEAEGWVFSKALEVSDMTAVLSTNSGFGGINNAVVLTK